jgi:uncharacterized protein YggE
MKEGKIMDNKKIAILLIVTLVLVAVMLVFSFVTGTVKVSGLQASASGAPDGAKDSVAVYGEGKVSINPDVAYITLGYENIDADPQKAQDDNTAQMSKIIAAVKGAGIADSDIQTSQYYVGMDYYSDNTVKDYRVTDTTDVTITDIGKAGSIIKVAYDSGANLFYGIKFDIIKRQDAYIQALDLAMSRAEEKAKKLASDTGRSIAGVIGVQESQSASNAPYYYPSSQLSNYAISQAPSNSQSGNTNGTITSGKLEITAIVNVTYRLN